MSLAANKPFAIKTYELVYNDEDARACTEIPDSACRVSPTNFMVLLLSSFLTKLGDAVANPKTVLTWVMSSVGAPVYLLGFLVPIRESGSLIPQLVIAAFIRRLAVRKWVWVSGSIIQALSLIAIGVVAMTMSGVGAGFSIIGLLVVFSLARGLCSVAAKDVLGKTIDKGRRGRLNGWSASAAGLITIVLGSLLIIGSGGDGTPRFYGAAMIGAAALWITAALIYSRVKEFPGETAGGRNAFREAIAGLGLLREDKPFRWFVITRSLLLCSALTAPYFVALGQANIGSGVKVLGAFIVAGGIASLVAAPVWGVFSDISSRKVMLGAAALTSTIAVSVAVIGTTMPAVLQTVWFLPLSYFLLSVAHAGVRVARKTYVVDLAGGNKRTDYVAVSNTVIGFALLASGLIGTLAAAVSLLGVVAILGLMGAAGAVAAALLPEV